jgi:hypothetical protein
VVPYEGEVYADADGRVWRITCRASEIPEEVDVQAIETTIDYGPVTIGSREYLLPERALVMATTRDSRIRNELTFQQYRKFESSSTITYGPESGTNPPRD